MKYGDFKQGVKDMLLEEGEIHGTDAYLDRTIRVSLLEALAYFPTLRPDALLSIDSSDVIVDGKACEFSIPAGITVTEMRLIPSGWVFDGDEQEATSDPVASGGGVLDGSTPAEDDTVILTDSGATGWEVEKVYYVVNVSGPEWGISLEQGGAALLESTTEISTVKFRKVKVEEFDTWDRLPVDRIPWADRYNIINGLVASCDKFYAISPDRDRIIIHPVIDFEKILQVSHRTIGTKFDDADLVTIPEALEDRFITICADFVRSRIAKDIDRDASLSAFNRQEFKRGLRSIFNEVPK